MFFGLVCLLALFVLLYVCAIVEGQDAATAVGIASVVVPDMARDQKPTTRQDVFDS